MGVTQNSYIPRAWEVSDLKVSSATRPRPLNQILPSHLVYNYYLCTACDYDNARAHTLCVCLNLLCLQSLRGVQFHFSSKNHGQICLQFALSHTCILDMKFTYASVCIHLKALISVAPRNGATYKLVCGFTSKASVAPHSSSDNVGTIPFLHIPFFALGYKIQ